MAGPTPWNHNLHDHHLVLNEAAGCATALDAGCGDGFDQRVVRFCFAKKGG